MHQAKKLHTYGSAPSLIAGHGTGIRPQDPRAATVCSSSSGTSDVRANRQRIPSITESGQLRLPALAKPSLAVALLHRDSAKLGCSGSSTRSLSSHGENSIPILSPQDFPSPCQRKPALSPISRKTLSPDTRISSRRSSSPVPKSNSIPVRFSLEDYNATLFTEFGGQGKVWQGIHPITSQKVAIKETDISNQGKKLNYQRELEVYKAIKKAGGHRNICPVICSFTTESSAHLVLPFYQYDLFSVLKTSASKERPRAASQVTQKLLAAVDFLHNVVKYAHRDIKPENILLTSDDLDTAEVILCDFGLAGSIQHSANLTAKCGSKHYMAPELFDEEHKNYDAAKVDMWAVGMAYFVTSCGFYPWPTAEKSDPAFKAFSREDQSKFYTWVDKHTSKPTTPVFKLIFSGLCNIDPSKRISVEMAIQCLKAEAKDFRILRIEQHSAECGTRLDPFAGDCCPGKIDMASTISCKTLRHRLLDVLLCAGLMICCVVYHTGTRDSSNAVGG